MSRQELAETANAWLYEYMGRRTAIADRYIGALERGDTRWPSAHYRAALRAVLDKATDAELGFFVIHGHAKDPDRNPVVPALTAEPSGTAPIDRNTAVPPALSTGPGATTCGEAGGGSAVVPAGAAAVEVSVNAGGAVTVVCHDGQPGCVAVVAGQVHVLIDPATGAASVVPAMVDAPVVVGGARLYSLSERQAR
ncbi:hypothetical protein [Micromonospora sp. CB01531]|uniref:hypothetical protein n=1 Tax=Micromonospora sp. CB01531 TaxID=1718947 RepID=UPI00093905BA|nr:hypothetical protein [Micromonospora sp. CB01531]OKI87230.1 hypothetical protein A6A27_39755 [Micromonospora sp. CB01531]